MLERNPVKARPKVIEEQLNPSARLPHGCLQPEAAHPRMCSPFALAWTLLAVSVRILDCCAAVRLLRVPRVLGKSYTTARG